MCTNQHGAALGEMQILHWGIYRAVVLRHTGAAVPLISFNPVKSFTNSARPMRRKDGSARKTETGGRLSHLDYN